MFTFDRWTVAAIMAMAAASFGCRAGGYWLFRLVRPSPFLRAMLGYLPGAMFVSFVAPALATGGVMRWVGAGVTLAIMLATRSQPAAIVGGVAAAWAVWSLRP